MTKKIFKSLLMFSLVILCSLYFTTLKTSALNNNVTSLNTEEILIENTELPDAYCLRDDYIVFTQNQDKTGFCWNFAATMAASTTIMKATGEYYDFSELWTGISANNTSSYGPIGSGGGYSTHYTAAQKAGLMLEVDLPYSNTFIVSDDNSTDYYNFFGKNANLAIATTILHDSTTDFTKNDVDEMKAHIYNHGSLSMAFNFKKSYVEDNGMLYKFPSESSTNGCHAISVIGWDDNYEKEIYYEGSDTPVIYKGAWLVVNSYTENQGTDGVIRIFYDDSNILYADGFKYQNDTTKDFYFYDKIESGCNLETNVKGKYYGNYIGETTTTKQKNIFYDDVNMTYSYISSENTTVSDIEIYLGNQNVTNTFEININNSSKTFSIKKDNAKYGQYKVLVNYTNGQQSDSFLNNFFVTYGLIGEEIEFNTDVNTLQFGTGRDLEYYSLAVPYKNYIIYTSDKTGTISFLQTKQSIYSDKNMSIPDITYNISSNNTDSYTYTITSNSGYDLDYKFNIEYYEDTSLQQVYVFYDLDGGINHDKNYYKELANSDTPLALYEPTRPGYTFSGWYLDYGHSSKKIEEKDGVYYIDWDDIHHMGESPDLSALGYYKTHYNNSNTVFVYAHWEEVNYFNIDLTINGNGSSNVGDISVSENGFVKYNFTPDKEHCLYEIKINGIKVEGEDFENIVKNGLTLKNIQQDISIEVTFKEGYLLKLKTGKNIKSAYIARSINGTVYKYYDGDLVSIKVLPSFTAAVKITLVVELEEAPEGYTYVLDNHEEYTLALTNTYRKDIFIRSSNIITIDVGSAKEIKIEPVTVSYTVGENVLDHYISTDAEALSGQKFFGKFESGQLLYIFIKMPTDTYEYDYKTPTDFKSLGRQWYRKAIVLTPDSADLGTIDVTYSMKKYTVAWKNWDGTLIYSYNYEVHSIPEFNTSKYPTPTKPDTEQFSYEFIGWDKPIEEVTEAVSYIAVFKEVPRKFSINVVTDNNGITDKTGTNKIEYGSSITINITPNENFEIASIKVNGETIEITNSLVINNITRDMDIFIEFKSTIIKPETPNNQPSDEIDRSDEQKNNKVVWIIVGSVFVVDAVAAVTFTIIKLKKKQDK